MALVSNKFFCAAVFTNTCLGTRMCAGSHLANRQLYIMLLRLIWAFKIELSDDSRENEWGVDPLKVGHPLR